MHRRLWRGGGVHIVLCVTFCLFLSETLILFITLEVNKAETYGNVNMNLF